MFNKRKWIISIPFNFISGFYIAFLTEDEKVTGMAMTDDSWHGFYEKINWYENGTIHMIFVGMAIVMYLVCILGLVLRFVFRIVKKKKTKAEPWKMKRYFLQGCISFMNAGFLIYSLYFWGDRLRYSIPLDVKINLMMPVAGMAGTIILLVMNVKEYTDGLGKVKSRVWDRCYIIVSVLYLLILMYWNLFGFQY